MADNEIIEAVEVDPANVDGPHNLNVGEVMFPTNFDINDTSTQLMMLGLWSDPNRKKFGAQNGEMFQDIVAYLEGRQQAQNTNILNEMENRALRKMGRKDIANATVKRVEEEERNIARADAELARKTEAARDASGEQPGDS